jgi:hypothetical protein
VNLLSLLLTWCISSRIYKSSEFFASAEQAERRISRKGYTASLHSDALAHRKAVTVTHDVTLAFPPHLLLLRCSYHLKSPSPPTLVVAPLLSSPPHPLSLISSSVTISSDWYATCHRTCLGFPRAGFTGICRLKSSTYPVLDSSYDCNLLARDQH